MFDIKTFPAVYAASLAALSGSERITRTELALLSRITIHALHTEGNNPAYGDIRIVNDILVALTHVNREMATAFFKKFSGFSFDNVNKRFTSKDKKIDKATGLSRYDEAYQASQEFLEDPLNNVWSWMNSQKVEITPKEFSIGQSMGALLKKAHNKGVKNNEILAAVMANGLSIDDLIAFMGTLEGLEVNVN